MTDPLEALREHLGHRRLAGRSADCLSDETIEALADGSLPALEAINRAHFDTCTRCLTAYAETRALLEAAAPSPPAPVHLPRHVRRVLGSLVTARVSLGWAVAATAIATVGTWLVSSEMDRSPGHPSGRPVVDLSHRTDAAVRAIAGVVETIKDTSTADLTAHVVELRVSSGERYAVFVWGPPTVRVGDRVIVDGVFMTADGADGRPVFKGVANVVRVAP
jgi:hypothetical protein